jgi:flagellar motor switch protein FliN/FliY
VNTIAPSTQQQIADTLVVHLPNAGALRAVESSAPYPLPANVGTAILATWVGESSAEFALILNDTSFLTEAAGSQSLVHPTDVVLPALEESAGVLGTGVLSGATTGDASALFADRDSAIYELRATDDSTVGWYLVRVRAEAASAPASHSIEGKLGRINEVEMTLTVEIGRTRMPIRSVLGLEVGAVVELDRAVGAPADVLLNGRLIATGEVVVVDQEFAVRITRILDGSEATAR